MRCGKIGGLSRSRLSIDQRITVELFNRALCRIDTGHEADVAQVNQNACLEIDKNSENESSHRRLTSPKNCHSRA
jgi:hypothetical protein